MSMLEMRSAATDGVRMDKRGSALVKGFSVLVLMLLGDGEEFRSAYSAVAPYSDSFESDGTAGTSLYMARDLEAPSRGNDRPLELPSLLLPLRFEGRV